jgi:hypothetical protein
MLNSIKTIPYKKILKIGVLLMLAPVCIFGVWCGLLMFGIAYADTSAHSMEPSLPSDAQLINVNKYGGAEGSSEDKTYYTSVNLEQVLAEMEKQRGVFTKSTDLQGHDYYSNLVEDRSLPMRIVSDASSKEGIPGSFPGVYVRIQSERGTDPTGTTIVVSVNLP